MSTVSVLPICLLYECCQYVHCISAANTSTVSVLPIRPLYQCCQYVHCISAANTSTVSVLPIRPLYQCCQYVHCISAANTSTVSVLPIRPLYQCCQYVHCISAANTSTVSCACTHTYTMYTGYRDISAIKRRGYYLFPHTIYCGYYSMAATNQRQQLSIKKEARKWIGALCMHKGVLLLPRGYHHNHPVKTAGIAYP